MTKHKWRESLKSILESCLDPEKDEELRGTKAEIDGNVQTILKFLKEEDHNDKKESLAYLLEDFHNHYQSLYARYDHLTEEFRKKSHDENGKDSSSSSSDSSDSDDSPKKKGKRHGKVDNFKENTDVSNQEEKYKSALSTVEAAEKIKMDCNSERAKWSEEKSKLLIENAALKAELESERTLHEELNSQMNSKEDKICHLEKALLRRGDEVLSIQKEMENTRNESSAIIAAQREKIDSLEHQLELLQSDKSQLEVQIERGKQQSLEILSEITEKLGEIDAKNQEIVNLKETIEDLKTDLEIKVDEMNALAEDMRTAEVKQRLASQKLRTTEQILGNMEDEHQKKVAKLLEEQKLLEERIAKLSGTIAAYEEAQMKIVNEISDKVNSMFTGMDTFGMKFEEDYGHLESRIYEIGNELKVTVNWINGNNTEKNKMKNEIARLIEQMNAGEDKITELETMLQRDGDEIKRLIQMVKQHEKEVGELEEMVQEKDEKVGELIKKMNEKDNGILSLVEEKREAIRQLCIWIDYHCNRYNDLKDVILKRRGGRQRAAT